MTRLKLIALVTFTVAHPLNSYADTNGDAIAAVVRRGAEGGRGGGMFNAEPSDRSGQDCRKSHDSNRFSMHARGGRLGWPEYR